MLLVDLIIRATSLEAHYTDIGVMPSTLVGGNYEGTWRWSLHLWSGSLGFAYLLFMVSGIAAVCLTIGFCAPIATIACWVLWASVQCRTPLLQNGGDDLLRMLLFWAMFLPLPSNGRFKLGTALIRYRTSSIASAALLLQVSLMYFMAGSWKLTGDWLHGNELHRIFCDGGYARPLAYALQSYPNLTSISGTAVVVAEHLLAFLLWIPPRYWRARCAVVAALALMHVGVELTLTVGLFSFVCWTALLLFLPTGFWDAFEKRMGRRWAIRRGKSESTEAYNADIATGVQPAPFRIGGLSRAVAAGVVLFSLLYVITWNLAARRVIGYDVIPPAARRVGELLSLQQSWRLFDYASNRDGWFIVLARQPDYRYADLLRDGVPADRETFSRPAFPYRRFPDHRWRKFYSNLVRDHYYAFREPLCRYLAFQWKREHGAQERIEAIELQYMQELNDPEDPDAYMQRFLYTLELNEA
nr:HTTM domain-containing protein [Allorhodopirellula solitaria]